MTSFVRNDGHASRLLKKKTSVEIVLSTIIIIVYTYMIVRLLQYVTYIIVMTEVEGCFE